MKTHTKFRAAENKEKVLSLSGLITYLGKFHSDLGSTTALLRQLTKMNERFIWTKTHQQHFNELGNYLAQLPILALIDPQKRTRLIADASPVAQGSVLLKFDEENETRIIPFACKSLSEMKRR